MAPRGVYSAMLAFATHPPSKHFRIFFLIRAFLFHIGLSSFVQEMFPLKPFGMVYPNWILPTNIALHPDGEYLEEPAPTFSSEGRACRPSGVFSASRTINRKASPVQPPKPTARSTFDFRAVRLFAPRSVGPTEPPQL